MKDSNTWHSLIGSVWGLHDLFIEISRLVVAVIAVAFDVIDISANVGYRIQSLQER